MKKHWKLLVAAGIVTIILGFVVYTVIRVNTFVGSVFAEGTPQVSRLRTPPAVVTVTPAPTNRPATVPATAANISGTVAPTNTPLPAPTATPTWSNAPIIQQIKGGQRITMLIMGYGGAGHDGEYLTDTLMVASYDPVHNAVSMINIPRDTYVQVAYGGFYANGQPKAYFWSKINSAFAYVMAQDTPKGLDTRYQWTREDRKLDAAANLTRDTVEQIIGVPIDYWAAVNFNGFRKLIDAIGGVDVTVEKAFDDYEYPANDDSNVDASVMHIHFDAGLQHMNGERAIQFSRSRKSIEDGSDFARSKRQMLVMQAIRAKLTQPSVLLSLFGVMDALQGNIRTNVPLSEVQPLTDYARSSEGAKTVQTAIFVQNILSTDNLLTASTSYETGDIVYPRTGKGNYKEIQAWVKSGFNGPEVRKEAAAVQLYNATGTGGLATSEYTYLFDQGFTLHNDPLWAQTQSQTLILDFSEGKATLTLAQLRALYPNATVVDWTAALSPSYSQYKTNGALFSVVLGRDFQGRVKDTSSKTGSTDQSVLSGGSTGR